MILREAKQILEKNGYRIVENFEDILAMLEGLGIECEISKNRAVAPHVSFSMLDGVVHGHIEGVEGSYGMGFTKQGTYEEMKSLRTPDIIRENGGKILDYGWDWDNDCITGEFKNIKSLDIIEEVLEDIK